MKSRASKAQWIDRTLVRMPAYVALCTTEAAFLREMRRSKLPKSEWDPWIGGAAGAMAHFFRSDVGELTALVCLRRVRGQSRSWHDTLLVHEAVHVWQRVKEELAEANPSSEFEAYAIQTISKNLIDAFHAS